MNDSSLSPGGTDPIRDGSQAPAPEIADSGLPVETVPETAGPDSPEAAPDGPAGDPGSPGRKASASFLIRLFQGMLVGVGGILPGVSGGVLCAIFGLYQPIMEVLAHPIRNLKKHLKLLIPVAIGIVIGFLGLAKLVEWIFRSDEEIAVCLFAGLILGMMPSLWKEAGGYGRPRSSYIAMATSFVLLFGLFTVLRFTTEVHVTPNAFWFAVSGAFWGLGVIVPGMSASAPLLYLGLYEPLMNVITSFSDNALAFVAGKASFAEAVAGMSFWAVIPFAVGIVVTVIGLAKPVNYLLKKCPSQVFHAIFGIVTATTIPLIPYRFAGVSDFFIKLLCLAGGFVAAWLIDKISRRYAA